MPAPARPLLVTDDPALVEAVLSVAAVAGVVLDVAVDLRAARPRWRGAACVLVGHDVRPLDGLGARVDVVMVSTDLDDASVWSRAAALRCEHVVFLPDADAWLEARLRRATGADEPGCTVVAVLGGRGGAGASVVAAALAHTAWRTGRRTCLVDADPWSGGPELMFGLDSRPGGAVGGRLDLVVRGRDAGPLGPVVEDHRRGHDLVVVDLPRGDRAVCEGGLRVADTGLLVVPTEVRAIVGAHALKTWAVESCPDLRLVTRTVGRRTIAPEVVTTSLGLPVAGVVPTERAVEDDLDRGDPPAARRCHLRRWAEDFLLELDEPLLRIAS